MKPIITVEGISKKYQIDHYQGKYVTLRDKLQELATHPIKTMKKMREEKEEFWALKDVSFTINKGDVVGIIGANGAGKSTLLKILSRITPPTEGRITIEGRVASLLEVGTGFHPELTGRENIFLNGAILGMHKKEIAKKFDEIVDFSGVEKFIDTPVKFYSSGMYVRLAFAVAAHMEPDILLVDEVLAVGDAEFQKKCLGKMSDITKNEGRTIIFVSHNLAMLQMLCPNSIFLSKGKLISSGPSEKIIKEYIKKNNLHLLQDKFRITYRVGKSESLIWENDSCLIIEIAPREKNIEPGWHFDLAGYTQGGTKIFAIESDRLNNFHIEKKVNKVLFFIKNCNFSPQLIRIDVGIKATAGGRYFFLAENCFQVQTGEEFLPSYKRTDVVVVPPVTYEIQ